MSCDQCSAGAAHLHQLPMPVMFLPDVCQAVALDGKLVAVVPTWNPLFGERIVELLNRHGLIDIPAAPFATVCPWPPPSPADRRDVDDR